MNTIYGMRKSKLDGEMVPSCFLQPKQLNFLKIRLDN